jgi:LacI family transcriptional regulator
MRKKRLSSNHVTLHDVAKLAGVSPMTVSRFLDGSREVRNSTQVQAAVKALGYSPNTAARNLASAGAIKLGLLYGNPSATFTSEFLIDLLENTRRIGCQLLIEKCTALRRARAGATKLIAERVDGVILPTPLCDSPTLLAQLQEARMPIIAVGTGRKLQQGLSLRIDNVGAAEQMTQHLLSLGHRDIGFILGHPRQIDTAQRYEGFAKALEAAGAQVLAKRIKQGQYTFRSGFNAASQLLKTKDRPTAIFASNDDMAAGALAAAHRMKLEVPRDLSIVGFDDTPLASTIWPSLTTIRQPVDKLTRLAVQLLIEDIRRRRQGKPSLQRQELVKLTLVRRESTSRIRGAG